jgi:hypothetical protein
MNIKGVKKSRFTSGFWNGFESSKLSGFVNPDAPNPWCDFQSC